MPLTRASWLCFMTGRDCASRSRAWSLGRNNMSDSNGPAERIGLGPFAEKIRACRLPFMTLQARFSTRRGSGNGLRKARVNPSQAAAIGRSAPRAAVVTSGCCHAAGTVRDGETGPCLQARERRCRVQAWREGDGAGPREATGGLDMLRLPVSAALRAAPARTRRVRPHRRLHHRKKPHFGGFFLWRRRRGFEPSVGVIPLRRFSKPLVSATHPRLRRRPRAPI